jgi:SAM-dependent methyltransferase
MYYIDQASEKWGFLMVLSRLRSAIRYVGWSDSPLKWRVSVANCPLCGTSVFISMRPDAFMTRCLRCTANVVNLSLIPVIQEVFGGVEKEKRAYELSSYGATLSWLKKSFGEVTTSEYFPDAPTGSWMNGTLNQDVQHLTFADETFDLVTSNQVFEHVPDDMQGYREICRVLKKNGAFIFSVPLYDIRETVQLAKLSGRDIVFFGEPEYHDSRLGGPKSAPTFWHHSVNDIADRVKQAGFSDVSLIKVTIARSQQQPATVVCAIK